MRGTRNVCTNFERGQRIIPAHAGNTNEMIFNVVDARDHPRACGEHQLRVLNSSYKAGSSPRMRGTLSVTPSAVRLSGIIPAHAGNTPLP